jgi:glycosyltransferase involved in cell wall biosynthesis
VLHLIETGGPGGAERMLLTLADRLAAGRSVIGLIRGGWLETQAAAAGIPCVRLKGPGRRDPGILAELVRVIRRERIGVVHAHEFYMSLLAAAASLLTRVPAVCTVHGKHYYPDRRRRRWLYRLAAARAQMVAVSHELADYFCATTGVRRARVRVVHNGIDVSRYAAVPRDRGLAETLGIPRDAFVVGTLGNLYPVKGHADLVRALGLLRERCPRMHLVMLGRGEMREPLLSLAASLRVPHRLHLAGFREDAAAWLGVMDAFAMPSLSEGMPLSLLEAMAAGLPIAATRVGGVPEALEDGRTGLLVPPGDPRALAGALARIAEEPVWSRDLGRAAQRHVREHFALDAMVRQYQETYDRTGRSARSAPAAAVGHAGAGGAA